MVFKGDSQTIADLLSKHPIFSILNKKSIEQISKIATVQVIKPGEILINEKMASKLKIYLIISGSLEAFRQDKKFRINVLSNLKPNDVLGEPLIFGVQARTASVRAKEISEVLVIPLQVIDSCLKEDPSSAALFLKKLYLQTIAYLKKTNEKIVKLLIRQRSIGYLIINLVGFLSIFTILLPWLQRLVGTQNPLWITTLIVFVASILLMIKMLITKVSLSTIGICKRNLTKSLWESILLSIIFFCFIIFVKFLAIEFGITKGPLFYTYKNLVFYTRGVILTDWQVVLYGFVYALHSFFQELIARGSLQGMFVKFITGKFRNTLAIVLASLIFSSVHSYYGYGAVMAVFFPGLFWGWLYLRHGNIFGVSISHMMIGLGFFGLLGGFPGV